jgi:hypothetical protein
VVAGHVLAGSAAGTAFGIVIAVVIASWALLFAVMIGALVMVTVMRGRRARKHQAARVAVAADPNLPARLAEVRRADPHFDEQMLLEAAQMACLVMFAAMSDGDEQAIRYLTASPFWSTFMGRYLWIKARDARRERATTKDQNLASSRMARLPVDYQAIAPELIGVEPGRTQRARVRVSFNQLQVVVAPGAAGQVAMASATSLASLAASFGGAMGERIANSSSAPDLGWVSWAGQYDLAFTRPGGARTDPDAALASRTCTTCGATYGSELATACGHCKAPRPLPWGLWRLASIAPVE